MGLCLKEIEESINTMDHTYDANFGDWIKNENNNKIVGANIKNYIDRYKESDFITVIKWIVKDWTLKSIILFSKKLIIDELYAEKRKKKEEDFIREINKKETFKRRIKIISGLIYTWNPIFISEFLLTTSISFSALEKCDFYYRVLDVFEEEKLSEILSQMENKMDKETMELLILKFKENVYLDTNDKWKRTNSLVNAFNLI